MNSRWQALKFCFDAAVVVVVEIFDQFLLEMRHRLELIKMEKFALDNADSEGNPATLSVVQNDAASYSTGDKSAEECAELIRSRIKQPSQNQ